MSESEQNPFFDEKLAQLFMAVFARSQLPGAVQKLQRKRTYNLADVTFNGFEALLDGAEEHAFWNGLKEKHGDNLELVFNESKNLATERLLTLKDFFKSLKPTGNDKNDPPQKSR